MFSIGSSSFGKWYAIIGLQKEDLRNSVIVMRNKIKIDYITGTVVHGFVSISQ